MKQDAKTITMNILNGLSVGIIVGLHFLVLRNNQH